MHNENAFKQGRGDYYGPDCGTCFAPGPRCLCKGLKAGQIHQAARRDESGYSADVRAAEKQTSRDEDERALASGEKTQEQLRRENGAFFGMRVRINYGGAKSLAGRSGE